jgi:hypothetical protein
VTGAPRSLPRPSALAGAVAVVALPLVIAAIALRADHWYPVLDLAMTEFRVRDVFSSHTPIIGLPGRIGEYPNQGSHPGPLSFYLLAPPYRLLGSSSWALQVSAVVVHVAAIVTALWIGRRRGGLAGVAAVAALLAVVIRGYGQLLLTQPWNPYLPLLAWIVVLLAVWSVLAGDSLMLVPLVVAASLCAQTHVPYLVSCAVLTIGALVYAASRPGTSRRHAAIAAGVGVLLWLPPMLDQLVHDPGNVRKLLDHFSTPSEPVIGFGDGVRLALRHLDVWAGFVGDLGGSGQFVSPSSPWRGVATLVVWAVSVAVAWRIGSRTLKCLHVTVAAALVLGLFSMVRIFGLAWYYLTLWAWGTTTVAVAAIVWTGLSLVRNLRPRHAGSARRAVAGAAAALAVLVSVSSAVAFADAEVPEERLSEAVAALSGPTYDAVIAGLGVADGTGVPYQVRWSDAADIGSPGFGLLNELERRGLDVAGDEFFDVPLTAYRWRDRSADIAQIHLATGAWIDTWAAVPGAVLVASYEPRDRQEQVLYAETRQRVIDRMRAEGRSPELIGNVDCNLFLTSLSTALSSADLADIELLLELGQPMAVFIAPGDADPPPGGPCGFV